MLKKEKGFTLIELMVVVVIMGLMLGIALPRLVASNPYRQMINGRDQVKADISILHQKSMIENRCYGAAFLTANKNQYTIFEDVIPLGQYTSGTDRVMNVKNLPRGVEFDISANQVVAFQNNGILNANSNISITLKNLKDEQTTLTVMLSGIVMD